MSKEYIIEFIPQGQYVKVIAIDPVTYTEVTTIGAARASTQELQRIAIKKLEYVLNKNKNGLDTK